jgi:DNA gyrase subunit A
MQITPKTGEVIGIKAVKETNDLMITNKSGIVIRLSAAEVPLIGRATQGVRLIRLGENDSIADVTVIERNQDEQHDDEGVQLED